MPGRPRIVIVSLTRIAGEPRVQRQVAALREFCDLELVGLGPQSIHGVPMTEVPWRRRTLGQRAKWLAGNVLGIETWAFEGLPHAADTLRVLQTRTCDLVIAHDLGGIQVALMAGIAPVMADFHEYAPGEFSASMAWRMTVGRMRTQVLLRQTTEIRGGTVVCGAIRDLYRERFGLELDVVANAAPFAEITPSAVADHGPLRLVHHGGAMRERRLDVMCRAIELAGGGAELHLHLVGHPGYIAWLRRRHAGPSIHFHDPIPQMDLVQKLAEYDVGVFLLPPESINYRLALPNKFFDFVQARLGIVIGPSPEMAALVQQHGLGMVAPDFTPESFAAILRSITRDQVRVWKNAAHVAAGQLCAEADHATTRAAVARALRLAAL